MLNRPLRYVCVSMAIALGGAVLANDQVDTTGPNHSQTYAHQNWHSHQEHMSDQAF